MAGLIIGVAGGHWLLSDSNLGLGKHGEPVTDDMDHEDMTGDMSGDMADMQMGYTLVEVDAELPIPKVEIAAIKDTMNGYNLRIMAENFTFDPETVGGVNEPNRGHAHVYVNDTKVARVYGEWFHLDDKYLEEGQNEILVTLNANDHNEWAYQSARIADTLRVEK